MEPGFPRCCSPKPAGGWDGDPPARAPRGWEGLGRQDPAQAGVSWWEAGARQSLHIGLDPSPSPRSPIAVAVGPAKEAQSQVHSGHHRGGDRVRDTGVGSCVGSPCPANLDIATRVWIHVCVHGDPCSWVPACMGASVHAAPMCEHLHASMCMGVVYTVCTCVHGWPCVWVLLGVGVHVCRQPWACMFMCMDAHVHVCSCVCMPMCMDVHVHGCSWMLMCMDVHMHVCSYACMFICMYVHVYGCLYA